MINKRILNGYTIVGLWTAFLVFGLYLFNFSSYPHLKVLSGGMDLPEELFGATWDYQTVFLDKLGSAGSALYLDFQWLDFLNALLFGLVLATTIYLLLSKLEAPKAIFVAVFFPVATALFDFVENGLMIANLGNLPILDKGLSSTFSLMTKAKLISGTISIFVLITCIVALGVSLAAKRFKR